MKNEVTSFGVCSGSIAMQYSAKMVLPQLQNTFPEAERDTKSSHGVSCRSGKVGCSARTIAPSVLAEVAITLKDARS